MRRERLFGGLVVGALVLAACGSDDGGSSASMSDAVETYADGVHASYEASLESATAMDAAIDAFVADPTDATLEAAKQAWLDARDDYGLDRGVPLLRRPDRQRGDRTRGPDQRVADGRGLRRLRRGRSPRPGIINDPDTYPDDRRGTAGVAQRGGRRDQHLHRLARHRVPALGSGPQRGRARRPPGVRLRRRTRTPTVAALYLDDRVGPARRPPAGPRRRVGAGPGRQLPRRVPRRSSPRRR